MRVISKLQCGFKRDGSVLLRKGDNTLAEPLTAAERAFVEAMEKAKLIEIVSESVPDAPISETHLRAAPPAPESLTRVNATATPRPMRRRSAAR